MIIPLYVSIEKLDPALLEAAADFAPDAWRASERRRSADAARHCGGLCARLHPLARSVSRAGPARGRQTAYIGNLIQSQFAVARDMPFGAALSFVLSLVVALLLLVFASARDDAVALDGEMADARLAGPLGAADRPRLPLPVRPRSWCWRRCRSTRAGSRRVGGLHPRLVLRRRPRTRRSSARSATACSSACAATVVATALGTAAALAFHRHRFRRQAALDALLTLPTVAPEIVLAASLLLLFAALGLRLGFATVILAHVGFTVSYASSW